jgi:hypothetical protein
VLKYVRFVTKPVVTFAATRGFQAAPTFALPDRVHFFGTNDLGQDLFSTWLWDARASLVVAALASTVRHARVPVLIARSGAAEYALADTSPNAREGGVSTPTAAPEGVWLELSPSDVELIVEGLNALRLTGRTSAAETDAIHDLQGRLHSSLPEGLVVDASK